MGGESASVDADERARPSDSVDLLASERSRQVHGMSSAASLHRPSATSSRSRRKLSCGRRGEPGAGRVIALIERMRLMSGKVGTSMASGIPRRFGEREMMTFPLSN